MEKDLERCGNCKYFTLKENSFGICSNPYFSLGTPTFKTRAFFTPNEARIFSGRACYSVLRDNPGPSCFFPRVQKKDL